MVVESVRRNNANRQPVRWWLESEDTNAGLWSAIEHIESNDTVRREEALEHLRLYLNREVGSLEPASVASASRRVGTQFNLTRSAVDSVHAKITKNRPRARAVTEGGDWGLQRKARLLEQFLDGIAYRNRLVEQLGPDAFRDAELFRVGVIKVIDRVENRTDDKGNEYEYATVVQERVLPWEIYVDPLEAVHGKPRNMYHVRPIDRAVLLAMPGLSDEERDAIEAAPRHTGDGESFLADQVELLEGWHLPSSPGGSDGRHVLAVRTGLINMRDWTDSDFPFSVVHWNRPISGFYGEALASEVEGVHIAIEDQLRLIGTSIATHASTKILASKAEIDDIEAALTNDFEGSLIGVNNPAEIQWIAPQMLSPEVYQHLDRLRQIGYEGPGISQLHAQSKKPSGIESGVALREYNDINTERFLPRGQMYEEFIRQCGVLAITAARRLYREGHDVETTARVRRRRKSQLARIKWSECNLDEDAFELRILPASALPTAMPGRYAAVEGMIKMGQIDGEEARYLLDLPDLDASNSRALAKYELVLDQVERMLDEETPVAPSPYQDLNLAMEIGRQSVLEAELEGAPDEVLDLVRDYIERANMLLKRRAQEQAQEQAAGAAPAVPPGAGVPQPGVPMGPPTNGVQ